MLLPPLHGVAGAWDEVVCLLIPATAIMAVALAVLREGRGDADEAEDEAPRREPARDGDDEAALAPEEEEGTERDADNR